MSPTVPARVSEVLMSGFIGQGKINDEFEEALRGRLGSPYVATTNSATSAEHLAFHRTDHVSEASKQIHILFAR